MKQFKHILAFALSLSVLFLFTGCASTPEKHPESSVESTASTEITTPTSSVTESTTEETQAEETQPEETTQASNTEKFDTSWAKNEFEKLIPEPPFTDWTTTTENNTYLMELEGISGNGYETMINYIMSLKEFGFEVDGGGKEFLATDSLGNTVKIIYANKNCSILITKNK